LIPSASPLSEHLDGLVEMERCGAGAIVLHSLFEDPYQPEPNHVDRYLDEIAIAKRHIKIPIIASLNANTAKGWIELAQQLEQAGSDALELNIYNLSLSPEAPSVGIEGRYLRIIESVTAAIKIPIAVKVPPFFTNLALMTSHIEDAGAKGVVFFNRFYQPDVDLLSMGPGYSLRLSTASENRLPMRWISLLYRQVRIDLAASTGIRTGGDVLKMILSGASATQLCSVLLQRGIPWLQLVEQELQQWMETCEITSLKSARGQLSHPANENPGEIEREEYRRALQGYSQIDVPDWRDEVPLHIPPARATTGKLDLSRTKS
jgi:dihydroorotate dehydrogenase (fumarate)